MRVSPHLCSFLVVLGLPQVATAREPLPDPTTIELPSMTFGDDPKVSKNGYKFSFFHNPNISFAEAYADFADCRSHLVTGSLLSLPGFVPWIEVNRREIATGLNPYGIVGAALGNIIGPKIERGARNNRMRLCMERRNYVRYALDESSYEAINEGEEVDIIAIQAKLATGPAPQTPPVTE